MGGPDEWYRHETKNGAATAASLIWYKLDLQAENVPV